MVRSRIFGLLAITLCLVVCSCANANVTEEDANKAAEKAKKTTADLLNKIKNNDKDTHPSLKDAEIYKKNAEEASTEAEKEATGNPAAVVIAQNAKKALDEVLKFFSTASALEKVYNGKIKTFIPSVEKLDKEATDAKSIAANSNDDYTPRKKAADDVQSKVEAVFRELNEHTLSFIKALGVEKTKMSESVTAAQLAKYHVKAIVADTKIKTLFESAETDIKLTEQKIDKTKATVQEIKNLHDNSPADLKKHILAMYSAAQGHFSSASGAVEEAKKAKEDILQHKTKINAALEKVKGGTHVEDVKHESDSALRNLNEAEIKFNEIKKALDSATMHATNTEHQKKTAVKTLTQGKYETSDSQDKDKANPSDPENSHLSAKDATKSPVMGGNTIFVYVSLLLALIACAALH